MLNVKVSQQRAEVHQTQEYLSQVEWGGYHSQKGKASAVALGYSFQASHADFFSFPRNADVVGFTFSKSVKKWKCTEFLLTQILTNGANEEQLEILEIPKAQSRPSWRQLLLLY